MDKNKTLSAALLAVILATLAGCYTPATERSWTEYNEQLDNITTLEGCGASPTDMEAGDNAIFGFDRGFDENE